MRRGGPATQNHSGADVSEGGPAESADVPLADPPRTDLRGFKAELTPIWLHTATLLAGHRPLEPTGALRVGFVGGGDGCTPAVVAAVHPGAEVWWWNPTMRGTERARLLRDGAQLDNLSVHERPDPPADLAGLDLVVVDGVIDSVTDADRGRVLRFAAQALRPGGIACLAYRTVIGWGEVAPVHHLLRHLVAQDPRPTRDAVRAARSTLVALRDGGAQYLASRPLVSSWVEAILALSADDLLHHVVDRALHPVSHAQLVDAVRPHGWTFVGPAHPADLVTPELDPALGRLVAAAPSAVLHETFGDLALRRTHRVDVFRVGAAPLGRRQRHQAIAGLGVAVLGTDPSPDDSVPWAARLGAGTATVAELATEPDQQEEALRSLLATGVAHPLAEAGPAPGAAEAARRLTALVGRSPVPAPARVLVAPALGSAVPAAPRPDRDRQALLGMR